MVDERDLLRERIHTLTTYIQLLEKVNRTYLGMGFNQAERTVMASVDRRINWKVQLLAVMVGVGIFVVGLGMGRLAARSLSMLLSLLILAAALGLYGVIAIFRRARQQIVKHEIRVAQLEIFHLEDQMCQQGD